MLSTKQLQLNPLANELNKEPTYFVCELNPTQEELEEYKNMLFSDDIDMVSMAISFFSQAIPFVTPEIFQRILSLKECPDLDIIENIISFLKNAIQSKEIPQDLLMNQNVPAILLSIFQNNPNKSLKELAIDAISQFSKRSEEACKLFFEQDTFLKCCQVIQESVTSNISNNINLISNCLQYINLIYRKLDTARCDSLSSVAANLYQFLIQSSQQSKIVADLTLNSIHFFIMHCSDEGLSIILNENLINFVNFMVGSSVESIYYVLILFVAISYHDSKFFTPFLPTFSTILQDYMMSSEKNEKVEIAILGTIRNLSANDDQAILSFLTSQPVLAFLQSSISNQSYSVAKQAIFAFAYLSLSAIETFRQFIWENHQETIPLMIDFIEMDDPESIANCFICLKSLLLYLQKTNKDSYKQCIQFILCTDIEKIINDVLGDDFDENIIELTQDLSEILCIA